MKITKSEDKAINDFLKAAKALPKSLCIIITDEEPSLSIYKRTHLGAIEVAKITKTSLFF